MHLEMLQNSMVQKKKKKRKKVATLGHRPVGESVEVAAEVGNELLRQLLVVGAAGVELRKATEEERWWLLSAR